MCKGKIIYLDELHGFFKLDGNEYKRIPDAEVSNIFKGTKLEKLISKKQMLEKELKEIVSEITEIVE